MTLLITTFAAIVATILWYRQLGKNDYQLGFLSLMFWGAAIMWLVDAVMEYIEMGAEYFNQAPVDMINDSFLGLTVIAIGMVIWLITLIIKDPKGLVRKKLLNK